MQISTPSSPEIDAPERRESSPPQCPVCSGSLLALHNFYRCSRCAYHLCVGCEQFDLEPPQRD
jgi:hypothetical protein